MKKVTVVGAGFAGLTVALRLAQKGFQVDLHEKSSRVGGLLGTDRTEFGISERAANALIRTERAENLFKELGLEASLPLESSKKRFIFRRKPKTMPLNPLELLVTAFRVVPRMLFMKSSLKPQAGETLQAWGLKKLGKAPTQFLLGPAMQGIYGNEISGLSASLILSPLFNKNRERYKGLLTGPGGMQDLVDHLETALRKAGVKIHLNSTIDLKDIQGPIVLATSANAAAALLENRASDISSILNKIEMSSLMSVTLFFKKAQTAYKGFGCLIPRGYDIKALGILMNSYIFKDRDKVYNETWILGGVKEADLLKHSDDHILKLIAEERLKVLGQQDTLLDFRINRWDHALPYYDLKLEAAQAELAKTDLPPDVFLHGNYLSGIGLSKILERSDRLSDKIAHTYG
ncbi:MAG: protoporphyrinogen/coproporphyrinogen oxidase [Bdellovibrio sp.]